MKKMLKKALKGFTLVELIVVIAIIAILSTVGFVSYTGYIRDSRNSVRQSDLAEGTNVITQFNAVNSTFPACNSGANQCYFCQQGGTDCTDGILTTDWDKMNVRKSPTDPKKKLDGHLQFYKYSHNVTDFALAATEEKPDGTFAAIVKGSSEGKAPNMTGTTTGDVTNGGSVVPYNWGSGNGNTNTNTNTNLNTLP